MSLNFPKVFNFWKVISQEFKKKGPLSIKRFLAIF
jgi:hypothetical protein